MSVEASVTEAGTIFSVVELFAASAGTGVEGPVNLEALDPDELLAGLREAESVTRSLMEMGESLSVATHAILTDAHRRASEALRLAEILAQTA